METIVLGPTAFEALRLLLERPATVREGLRRLLVSDRLGPHAFDRRPVTPVERR